MASSDRFVIVFGQQSEIDPSSPIDRTQIVPAVQPSGRAFVSGFLLFAVTAVWACGSDGSGGPLDVSDGLTERLETESFVFRYAAGDGVDAGWQERYQAWLESELSLHLDRKIEFRKYRDVSHKARLTGTGGNALAEPGAFRIHTIWPRDDHEVVHVLVNTQVSDGPALFGEGVAVAHQMDPDRGDGVAYWSGRPIHDRARDFLAAGVVPALDELVPSTDFRAHPADVTYPVAGSFVRHLLDVHGPDPFWAFLRGVGPNDAPDDIREAFEAAYGDDLDAAWNGWLDFLDGG